ncbi:MAG: hypothetical protein R2911_15815 [Caldilineaceae bacterium]
MDDKIINTFQQRRQLEAAIDELSQAKTERAMLRMVRQMARTYPASMMLNVLLKHLGDANSQLRGGLGHLATLLPPEEVTPALRSAAASRQNSAQMRFNAATILERFLGEDVPPALLSDLENSDELAFQSLCEAIEEAERNRYVLLEYVTQMREEEEGVAYFVLEQLRRLPAADRVDLLRLMAQDDRPGVAAAALSDLEALNPAEAGDRLMLTLHSLTITLPPDLRARVARQIRKLQFSGWGYEPPSPVGWRALLGPAEASGNQTVWILYTPSAAREQMACAFVSMVVNVRTGILATYGSDEMAREDLPQPHPVGELFTVSLDDDQSMVFLEAPFDYGRWLVQKALYAHWEGTAWQPLFGEYSLYNDWLWQFGEPVVDEALSAYFQPHVEMEYTPAELVNAAAELARHPSLHSWYTHTRMLLRAVRNDLYVNLDLDDDEPLRADAVLQEIESWPDMHLLFQGLQAGLQAQAAWLHLAGDMRNAEHAALLAHSITAMPGHENPLLLELFGRGLRGYDMEQCRNKPGIFEDAGLISALLPNLALGRNENLRLSALAKRHLRLKMPTIFGFLRHHVRVPERRPDQMHVDLLDVGRGVVRFALHVTDNLRVTE